MRGDLVMWWVILIVVLGVTYLGVIKFKKLKNEDLKKRENLREAVWLNNMDVNKTFVLAENSTLMNDYTNKKILLIKYGETRSINHDEIYGVYLLNHSDMIKECSISLNEKDAKLEMLDRPLNKDMNDIEIRLALKTDAWYFYEDIDIPVSYRDRAIEVYGLIESIVVANNRLRLQKSN